MSQDRHPIKGDKSALTELSTFNRCPNIEGASQELKDALELRWRTCSSFTQCKADGFNEFSCDCRNSLSAKLQYIPTEPSARIKAGHEALTRQALQAIGRAHAEGNINSTQWDTLTHILNKLQFQYELNPLKIIQQAIKEMTNPNNKDHEEY